MVGRESAESLAQDRQWLLLQSAALAAAANSITITDRTGTILWVNPAFCALTGYSAEEVLGNNPRVLKSGRQEQAFYEGFWRTILSGKTWRGEFINRRKDGQDYIAAQTVTPVQDADGIITHFIGVMEDVTDRKRAEAEIRRLNEHLEEKVRERTAQLTAANQELEAFAYSVSHDLRAPLRHIGAFAGLLKEATAGSLPEEGQRFLDHIQTSASQMRRLIDDLLAFSRTGRTEIMFQELSLEDLAREVIREMDPDLADRQIQWKVAPLPVVHADRAMLHQVFANLLANAVKYTRPRVPAEIELGCLQPNPGETVIFVRDNGVGFDMKYATKLFGVFQRLHLPDQFEGTGIGLANVRRIIARHGGRTWAEGQPDAGATFYFSLPNRASQTAAATRPEAHG
jgi:PAS domain S-box-containing protein